ncbi:MAG TPA: glycoside hydrolase family 2 protein [Pyrinomonadaceae bacterium]|nr:glycoside hydrolase family 2 protein [Pyrinomonadaceae bacterium]
MHRAKLFSATLALIAFTGYASQSQTSLRLKGTSKVKIPVVTGWQFREVGKDTWHSATVPGCVHTDLLNNKLIDDPFYRDNEKKLQWISKTDWEYHTTFNVASEILARDNLDLIFEGLDTYANVFLNDKPLLDADNMFRTWRTDSKRLLRAGTNTLRIRFRSPINEVLPIMAKMNYQLPAGNDQGEKTSPHTRKAPYQFGWDWGPRFVTSGIWRPVYLEAWNNARLEDLHILQSHVTADAARLTAEIEIVANINASATIVVDNITSKSVAAKRTVTLAPGVNRVSLDFVIPRPALWWPNGLGAQPLYSFKARLLIDGKSIDSKTTRTGVRSVELRQKQDESGKSFTFVINGVPIFAKGANWIPADSFPTRITQARYRQLLESVRDTNMNMVRVWGGGIYEHDDFYELSDEMGILVWQDFMFGCSLYPGDQPFLDNVRQEAIDNVKRLRNHPSIVIWVGNNEIESGWFHWGWKDQFPAKLWDDYLKLFYGVLPEVCASLDPSRPYWPASPSSNLEADPDSQKMGDSHYWQVWHASLPFSEYTKQRPRFMSEYGFQSLPQLETVNSYTVPADHDIESPVMMAHQRHPRGNPLIREYMLREYSAPKDFESFLYVSQVLQAEGIKIGAEHLRRIMPHNMGSLYWQLNDTWPAASWSSIDYTGRWKALQYYARRFYNQILVSPREENGNLDVFVVSDRLQPASAQLNVSLLDFEGNTLWARRQDIEIAPLSSRSYSTIPLKTVLAGRNAKEVFLLTEVLVDGKPVSTNKHFFGAYKELSMPRPQINFEVIPVRDGFKVTLSADKFARAVYLSAPNHKGFFTDNYFDLIPGQKVEAQFRTSAAVRLSDFRSQLKVRSLADAF